ncbi:hypothetical protein ACJJTC_019084 [Scirpophaga incertulas]
MSSPPDKMSETPGTSTDYFDEISGRFRSLSSTESEESFQIVFSDSPRTSRMRRPSDCESEDSFIVFEDPDSCYTSTDVFGDSEDESDSNSDAEFSDTKDVQVTKLSNTLSRTLSDLTDGSLYEDKALDEVDCAVTSMCVEIPTEKIADVSVNVPNAQSTGLLLNNEKKLLKRNQSPKKVHFSPKPPKVHVMRVWAFAARQARAGHWERCAIDRDRFKRRIADIDMAVSWVLKPQHRARVMFQRFMPWWNAQKRKEQAEKKAKEEELKMLQTEQEKNPINGDLESENGEEVCDINVNIEDKDVTDCKVDCKVDTFNDPTKTISDKSNVVKCSRVDNESCKTIAKIKEPPDDNFSNDLSLHDCDSKLDMVQSNGIFNETKSIILYDINLCDSHKSDTSGNTLLDDVIKVNGVVNKEISNTIDENNEQTVCQVTSINDNLSDTQVNTVSDKFDSTKCNGVTNEIIDSSFKDLDLFSTNNVNTAIETSEYINKNDTPSSVRTSLLLNDKSNNQSLCKDNIENGHQIKHINNIIDAIKYNGISKDLSKPLNVTEALQYQLTANNKTDISLVNDSKLDLILIKDTTPQFDKTLLNPSNPNGRIVSDTNKILEQKSHLFLIKDTTPQFDKAPLNPSNTHGRIVSDPNMMSEQKSQIVNGIPSQELGRILEYSLTNLELSFSSLSLY